ncbi:Clp protease N-terminal domain-containing protein [Kitasatospora sp. MAP5-34]|uniref:Clp protease N-terminal domain-containing protein n=1 Tax=Kitasatospora sp. MAP5-34 TaxID=3035102 RepID=UPI002474448A|nr:Clp protease N-terminal domain-containing protein [Kitasatospora sp. MAP5-34]MDH6580799.1 hypothetical protein [Kitasatospora sp. MAP5-34]
MAISPVRLDALIAQVAEAQPDGGPLGRVEVACQAAADLDEAADHLVGHFVDEARAAGFTWTQIGEHIGVTKQAARKRFAPRDVPNETAGVAALREKARDNVFGRYTDHARHTIVLAQENARRHEHPLISTEHILLGVCQEERGVGAKVIESSGVSLADLQDAITSRLAPATTRIQGHIPFAQEGKKTLELATRASLLLGHDRIGTEHLLLGLIAEGTGLAAQVLGETGVTEEHAQAEILRLGTSRTG